MCDAFVVPKQCDDVLQEPCGHVRDAHAEDGLGHDHDIVWCRNNVEMAFDVFKSELDGRRGRTGDPVRARGRLGVIVAQTREFRVKVL